MITCKVKNTQELKTQYFTSFLIPFLSQSEVTHDREYLKNKFSFPTQA